MGEPTHPCPDCHGTGWEQGDCKACGARPDAGGEINHGKGYYRLSEDGGGSELADPCPACAGAASREGLMSETKDGPTRQEGPPDPLAEARSLLAADRERRQAACLAAVREALSLHGCVLLPTIHGAPAPPGFVQIQVAAEG